MSAMEPLCRLIGIDPSTLSKEENILLEIELFLRLHEELKEIFREQHKDYFRLLKLTRATEDAMLEMNLFRFIIRDIVQTEEYTLEGIARYIDTHKDVVYDVATGCNTNPSAIFFRKLIELHRSVRRDLYQLMLKKIALSYLIDLIKTK